MQSGICRIKVFGKWGGDTRKHLLQGKGRRGVKLRRPLHDDRIGTEVFFALIDGDASPYSLWDQSNSKLGFSAAESARTRSSRRPKGDASMASRPESSR